MSSTCRHIRGILTGDKNKDIVVNGAVEVFSVRGLDSKNTKFTIHTGSPVSKIAWLAVNYAEPLVAGGPKWTITAKLGNSNNEIVLQAKGDGGTKEEEFLNNIKSIRVMAITTGASV